jgi:hypothetical protein
VLDDDVERELTELRADPIEIGESARLIGARMENEDDARPVRLVGASFVNDREREKSEHAHAKECGDANGALLQRLLTRRLGTPARRSRVWREIDYNDRVRDAASMALLFTITLAGCRACGESAAADAGSIDPSQRPMPTGMLAPAPVGDAAPSSAARLRIAVHQKGGDWTELQIASPDDRPNKPTFEHWRDDSRFVSLDAMTLLHDPFARAMPGFDLFLPRLFDREALLRLHAELLAYKQTWIAIGSLAEAKARWAPYSTFVRELPDDAAWIAARDALARTIDELASLAHDLGTKGQSLWVLGV